MGNGVFDNSEPMFRAFIEGQAADILLCIGLKNVYNIKNHLK